MAKLNAGGGGATAVVFSLCVWFVFVAGQPVAGGGSGGGAYGSQDKVVKEVRKQVGDAIGKAPGVGAALIRLAFHDCWVNGCDGSVLLDKTPYSSPRGTEKRTDINIGLGGFDVIDGIKSKVGDGVSCADIVVLAAREAVGILSRGKITYAVDMGRKDGVVSSAVAADATLPASTFDFDQLKANFAAKKFTVEELVILSGAHSVGVCHRSSFQDRLNATTATPIDGNYLDALKADVDKQGKLQYTSNPTEKNNIRDMDAAFRSSAGYDAAGVDTAAAGVLDNSYYHANLQNMVLLKSDWVLRTDGDAAGNLTEYRDNAAEWNSDFGEAMANLSRLPAEGSRFEIRKNCRVTNQNYY